MQAAASILYGGDSQDCLSLQALVSGQEGQNPGSPIESLPFPSTTALFEHAPFAECRQLDLGNPTGSGYLICPHVGSTDP